MFFYADSTILFRKLINFIQSLFLSPNPILHFFLKKHSFLSSLNPILHSIVSLSTNLVLFCHKDLCISFFPALSTMSKMSYDMQLFWHRSFSWGGKPRVFGVFIRYDSLGLFVWEVNNGGNDTGQSLRFLPRHVLEQDVFQIL